MTTATEINHDGGACAVCAREGSWTLNRLGSKGFSWWCAHLAAGMNIAVVSTPRGYRVVEKIKKGDN